MKIRISTVFATLLAGLVSQAGLAEGEPRAGAKLVETCLGCHGVEGYFNVYPSYHVPRLGGQSAKYIESALKAYRDGSRKHPTMQANVSNLSDQDMADIAAYLTEVGQ